MLDMQNLTIADLIELEDHGIALDDITATQASGRTPARMIAAVRFLQLRATNPAATWEDAINTRFIDKGRFAAYLGAVPVWLVTAKNPGLTGAAAALDN